MDEDYRLRKFTKEDLANFNYIEERTSSFPFVKDSLDYLLDVLYRFENYVVEKIMFRNKRQLKLRKNNFSDKTALIKIVDRIEEYSDELSIDERLFISKIRNLITHQMRRLHVNSLYAESRLRNKSLYLLEEQKEDKSSVSSILKPKQKANASSKPGNNLPGDGKSEVKDQQNKFRGNSLEKRKSENLTKYIKTTKLIRMMEDEFNYVTGIQKKACYITNCNDKSFSRWINASKTNNAKYQKWKNSISDDEKEILREQINAYLKKYC